MLRLVNLHYAPDVASTGQHLTDLAEHLVGRHGGGQQTVEVLTAACRYEGGRVAAPARETRNGVRVIRLWVPGFGRRSGVGRMIDYAVFVVQVLLRVICGRAAAGTIYLTTPPLLSVAGLVGRRVRGARYGIWSMDLHPDAEFAAGLLSPTGLLGRVLRWLSDASYRGADFVVALGPYMRQRVLAKGVLPDRVRTVPVWGAATSPESAAHGRMSPAERANFWRRMAAPDDARRERIRAIAGKFVVMYSGNAGIVHDFDTLLDAMRALRGDRDVGFVFVGGGPRRREIEDAVKRDGIENFVYLDYVPREDLASLLAAADVHLVTLRAAFAGISVPGKLYGIMQAARPVIFIGPDTSEPSDIVRQAKAGVAVDPARGRAEAVATVVATIRAWSSDPSLSAQAGTRALAAYRAGFEAAPNCEAIGDLVESCWPAAYALQTPDANGTIPVITAATSGGGGYG